MEGGEELQKGHGGDEGTLTGLKKKKKGETTDPSRAAWGVWNEKGKNQGAKKWGNREKLGTIRGVISEVSRRRASERGTTRGGRKRDSVHEPTGGTGQKKRGALGELGT